MATGAVSDTQQGSSAASGSGGGVSVPPLAARYAEALIELAEEQRLLDTVAADLRSLRGMLAESEDLTRLVRSPAIARADKRRAMDAVAEKAGFSQPVRNILGLLAVKGRLFAAGDIAKGYLEMLAARRGEVTAQVVTASEMTQAQLTALTDQLKAMAGTQVEIETRVDPSLLGGLVIRLGSRMIDASLKTKLSRLQGAMRGIG